MPPLTATDLENAHLDTQALGLFVNGDTNDIVQPRLGGTYPTIAKLAADAGTIIANAAGYEPPVAYAAGISIDRVTQTVHYNGLTYGPIPASVPFVTGAVFDPAKWRIAVTGETFAVTLREMGGIPDAREVRNAAMTSGSAVFTSAGAGFTAADVGKPIVVGGAGAAGAKLRTTIAGYTSATQITLTDAAATTVSGTGAAWGTDCSIALQAGLNKLIADRGGCLVVDGLFFLSSPIAVSSISETSGIALQIIGTGGDSAIWIGTLATVDAFTFNWGQLHFRDLNFIGVPSSSRDAKQIFHLDTTDSTFEHCNFYGLMATEHIIYNLGGLLQTYHCLFGGCFVAGNNGYVYSVIENKNWLTYGDRDSQFIDYGYFQFRQYSKSGFSGTLAWIRADTPSAADGARLESVFRLVGTRLDEGTNRGVVAEPTTGTIHSVILDGVRHNVSNGEIARGLQCKGVQRVSVRDCSYGWAATATLFATFESCDTVLIERLKLTDSVNKIQATNVGALIVKDSVGITVVELIGTSKYFPKSSNCGDYSLIKEGAATDADFLAAPGAGTRVYDKTNGRDYVKTPGGGWAYFQYAGGDLLGPELVTNGTFSANTAGWTAASGAGLSVVGNALRVTNSTSGAQAYQVINGLTVGKQYKFAVDPKGGTAAFLARLGNSLADNLFANYTTAGPKEVTFTATNAQMYITFIVNSAANGAYADFDSVSLRAA